MQERERCPAGDVISILLIIQFSADLGLVRLQAYLYHGRSMDLVVFLSLATDILSSEKRTVASNFCGADLLLDLLLSCLALKRSLPYPHR